MKKYIYLSVIFIFIGLFIASPYILDYWQWKSALKAVGAGLSVTEGIKKNTIATCSCSNVTCTTCTGAGMCTTALPPCVDSQSVTVVLSAGGMKCISGYLVNLAQGTILQGAQNAIIGGTLCNSLKVVSSENGCLGCGSMALINNPKVYAFKNKMKEIINFIIAGKRESKK